MAWEMFAVILLTKITWNTGAPSNPCTDTKFLVLFQETRNYPETYPQLPKEETVENPMVQKHVLELASILDVQNLFCDNTLDDY